MKYYQIKKGKIHEWVGKGQPTKELDSITGIVKGFKIEPETYNNQTSDKLILEIQAEEKSLLKMNFDSGYARAFISCFCNADASKPVEISPSYDEEAKKAVVFVKQDGKALKWKFTSKEPNGMPELEKIVFKGKEEFDNSKRLVFYREQLELALKAKSEVKDDLPF